MDGDTYTPGCDLDNVHHGPLWIRTAFEEADRLHNGI